MCQQLLTVNLDEKLNSSKCNLSLEPKMMTTLKHSRITALYVSLVTKSLPSVIFLEASRHKIR